MRRWPKIAMAAAIACFATGVVATPAHAAGHCSTGAPNCYRSWETLGGSKWNGEIQIRASYNDSGRHARRGYQRFTRDAGPSLDTGRLYTSVATSPSDTTARSRTDDVWDSPLWGDQYTTKYNYNFLWF